MDGRAAKPLGHAPQFREVNESGWGGEWCEIAERVPGFAFDWGGAEMRSASRVSLAASGAEMRSASRVSRFPGFALDWGGWVVSYEIDWRMEAEWNTF